MADNYIEKRMEELRNRRTTLSRATSTLQSPKDRLSFPFPSRRILILPGEDLTCDIALTIAKAYASKSSHTAIFLTDEEAEEFADTLSDGNGIRRLNRNKIREEFETLYSHWKGLDVIISGKSKELNILASDWRSNLNQLPDATFYTPRVFLICKERVRQYSLSGYSPSVTLVGANTVNPAPTQNTRDITPKLISDILLFLTLEQNINISEICF